MISLRRTLVRFVVMGQGESGYRLKSSKCYAARQISIPILNIILYQAYQQKEWGKSHSSVILLLQPNYFFITLFVSNSSIKITPATSQLKNDSKLIALRSTST